MILRCFQTPTPFGIPAESWETWATIALEPGYACQELVDAGVKADIAVAGSFLAWCATGRSEPALFPATPAEIAEHHVWERGPERWRLPELSAAWLVEFVREWRLVVARLSTRAGAERLCRFASRSFTAAVNFELGREVATDYLMSFAREVDRNAWPASDGGYRGEHMVAVLGNVWIDWTARQFDPQAPFPLVWTRRITADQILARRALAARPGQACAECRKKVERTFPVWESRYCAVCVRKIAKRVTLPSDRAYLAEALRQIEGGP